MILMLMERSNGTKVYVNLDKIVMVEPASTTTTMIILEGEETVHIDQPAPEFVQSLHRFQREWSNR